MAQTVYFMKGLPGSGKSTRAAEMYKASPGTIKRINKDLLREMLDFGDWNRTNEKFVVGVRNEILRYVLAAGFSTIIDDTNFASVHKQRVEEIALDYGAKVEEIFVDTPVEECIKNDLKRPRSVGEHTILRMHKQYLKPSPKPYTALGKPVSIICDIDGTLALKGERSPYDWARVGEDRLNLPVFAVLRPYFKANCEIILVSGRDSICRTETEEWLKAHNIKYDQLYMRPEGNNEKDVIIKKQIWDDHIKDQYNVLFVLDDRDQVVRLWRELGLSCFQVNDGDF